MSLPVYEAGRVKAVPLLLRGDSRLALTGMYKLLYDLLQPGAASAQALTQTLQKLFQQQFREQTGLAFYHAIQALEVMLNEGWVQGRFDRTQPKLSVETPDEGQIIHSNRDAPIGGSTRT